MGFRTSTLWFPAIPLSCHPNYRALTFTLAGLSPAEHTSLSWLQPPHHLISGRIESVPKSLMHIARAERGLQGGMGSILVTGVFSHGPSRSHVPPWNWNQLEFRSSPFDDPHFVFRMAPFGTKPFSR